MVLSLCFLYSVSKKTGEFHYMILKLEILLIVFRSLNVPGRGAVVGLFKYGENENCEKGQKKQNIIQIYRNSHIKFIFKFKNTYIFVHCICSN